jgi:hypothetical protein
MLTKSDHVGEAVVAGNGLRWTGVGDNDLRKGKENMKERWWLVEGGDWKQSSCRCYHLVPCPRDGELTGMEVVVLQTHQKQLVSLFPFQPTGETFYSPLGSLQPQAS